MFPPNYYQQQQASPYHPRPLMQNMMHTPAKKMLMGGVVTPNPRSSSERKRKRGTGHSTGYIIFAAHAHPKVRAENPGLKFGEISRVVNIFTLLNMKTLLKFNLLVPFFFLKLLSNIFSIRFLI